MFSNADFGGDRVDIDKCNWQFGWRGSNGSYCHIPISLRPCCYHGIVNKRIRSYRIQWPHFPRLGPNGKCPKKDIFHLPKLVAVVWMEANVVEILGFFFDFVTVSMDPNVQCLQLGFPFSRENLSHFLSSPVNASKLKSLFGRRLRRRPNKFLSFEASFSKF